MRFAGLIGLLGMAGALLSQTIRLELGRTITDDPSDPLSGSYSLTLGVHQYARIACQATTRAVLIELYDPAGKKLIEVNTRDYLRPSRIVWVAETAGEYRVAVSGPGRYEIRLEELREASAADRKRVQADQLTTQGIGQAGKAGYAEAVMSFNHAAEVYHQIGDREQEGDALNRVGAAYNNWHKADKAIGYFKQALEILKEPRNRMAVFNNFGIAYSMLSQPEKAISYLRQALTIALETKDRGAEVNILHYLGSGYQDLNQYEKTVEVAEQMRNLSRELKQRREEAVALNDLGNAYTNLSRYEKAISYYEPALEIERQFKDQRSESLTLTYLAVAYNALSQYGKSITYSEQALAIQREIKDQHSQGLTLNNLGNAYTQLKQYDKAVGYFERALAIQRELKDRRTEGYTLLDLCNTYLVAGQFQKGLTYQRQALEISRSIDDRYMAGWAMGFLGGYYRLVGQGENAIPYYEQALTGARDFKFYAGEGFVLNELGKTYMSLHKYDQAAQYYEQALTISHDLKTRETEAEVLAGLMVAAYGSHKPRLATFYGKQAVNTIQAIRTGIGSLSRDIQQSFLKDNDEPYHALAEILIAQGRLTEAEHVLALLKEEEYFQYTRRDGDEASALNRRADLTSEEREWQKRYDDIGGQLMAIGTERGGLLAKKTLTSEETQRLKILDRDISVGNQKFQRFLGDLAKNFDTKVEANRRIEDIQENQGIMEDLRELPQGAVVIYTIAAPDQFYAILRTPDVQKSYQYPITAAELNRKIADFRKALENSSLDPRPLGHELYKILMGSMAEDLRQAKANTLMWALDGALRYVPLAALYDGQQYLIEQYRVSVITLASTTRLKDKPDAEWKAVGLGVTKAHEDAPALPFVSSELSAIISTHPGEAGVMKGEIKLDGDFTRDSMREELEKRFPVVHIASHFRFQPGDDTNSFLMLGDGAHFSLAELKFSASLFGGVQLLTLSACNTGVGDGTEVEGFGTLAQRQGAKAVVASLWSVMDESTSRLMQEFYRIRESSPEITKLEALRQAQLALMRGTGQFSGAARGVSVRPDAASPDAPRFPSDPKAPFAHPYFWAPFFLMGNWL
jgi:CHAT domain-containing protein/Tfp pilus assembly protein PilF